TCRIECSESSLNLMSDTNWPTDSYRIFISYAREDGRMLALRLRGDLLAAGQDAWLDTAEIGVGGTWAHDIEEAIENCDLMLALLSHASYISPTCRAEQARALRKRKRIIPILAQPDADRPLELETLNYLDFSDEARYDAIFGDLMTAITTGYVPEAGAASAGDTHPMPAVSPSTYLPPKEKTVTTGMINTGIKRDANGFRRYLNDLRGEPWLGERHWWTYFLFTYADVQAVVDILEAGQIAPRSTRARHGSWDHTVRLNFRPRTPDLFGVEGIRPAGVEPAHHCPVPVYLLFDLESVITLTEARFSEGDVFSKPRTFSTAAAFRDMPFHRIYHDTWFRSDEREEILSARRAQVILPHALDLGYLRHIWCRSQAEHETLLTLMPEGLRQRWGTQITVRKDYTLFHARWVYVEQATLSAEGALLQFNGCSSDDPEACGPFDVRAEISPNAPGVPPEAVALDALTLDEDLALDLTAYPLRDGYTLRLFLDGMLAYAGRFNAG
ncbi:MAG: DarT ssDNA thymidine ADP-ribosyltransferase family protein, partial [Chloroflexota bacterium]